MKAKKTARSDQSAEWRCCGGAMRLAVAGAPATVIADLQNASRHGRPKTVAGGGSEVKVVEVAPLLTAQIEYITSVQFC